MQEQHVIEGYLSKDRTFTIQCPSCNKVRTQHLDDLPSDTQPPYSYDCSCGRMSRYRLVGYRSAHRKPSNLVASFSRSSQNGKVQSLCTVLDISVKGLRFSTDPVKNLVKGETITVSLILDDARRSKLTLTSKIKRINPTKKHLAVSVEYVEPTDAQLDTLRSYVIS